MLKKLKKLWTKQNKKAFGLFLLYDKCMNYLLNCLEIAHRIQKLKPWQSFYELDFFEIRAYEQEPIYVSIMGKAGITYGLNFYFGKQAFNELLYLVDHPELPNLQKARFQDALVVFYDKRDDLNEEDLAQLEAADIKLSKAQRGPYLRSIRKNYPRHVSDEELQHLHFALTMFEKALLRYKANKPVVYFPYGECLAYRENKNHVWSLRALDIEFSDLEYPEPSFSFEEVKQLNRNPFDQQIEIDTPFINALVDVDEEHPYLVRALMIVGVDDGHVYEHRILKQDEDISEAYAEAMIDFVEKYGRPEAIIVRDPEAASALDMLSAVLQIPLAIFDVLVGIDDFNESFTDFKAKTRFN